MIFIKKYDIINYKIKERECRMNELNETEFRIVIDKQPKRVWSFGICISHFYDETYIYLNLFKISISIGKLSTLQRDDWSEWK